MLSKYYTLFCMKFLAVLVLISALAIAACAAYFSIVGLALLFVGSGVSIVVMGTALEIGKIVAVSFLHQKWRDISLALKSYLILATLVLMGITSVGIYGYLSAGYNATSIKVNSYEQQIESNNEKIANLKADVANLKSDTYNQADIDLVNTNREVFIEQQLKLIETKEQKIQVLRSISNNTQKSSDDLASAKAALDAEKNTLDLEINKEIEQIKLYNERLSILDREVQTWLDQGTGGLFKRNGMDKARVIKEQQEKERSQIDIQIEKRQARIEQLRSEYKKQVEIYNNRVASIDSHLKSQSDYNENTIAVLEKEVLDIRQGIEVYNKQVNEEIQNHIVRKQELVQNSKQRVQTYEKEINELLVSNSTLRESINKTDVGTFKFVAKSMGLTLDQTVTYFIWAIMFVFDPLAVCLILCFNYLVGLFAKKKVTEPTLLPVSTVTFPTPTITPEPMKSSEILLGKPKQPKTERPEPTVGEVERFAKIYEQQRAEKAARHAKK